MAETVALISAFASTAATAVSAVGQYNKSKFESKVASQNAQIVNEQGVQAAESQRKKASAEISRMRTAFGASGLELGSGSIYDTLTNAVMESELENKTIRRDYAIRAAGYKNEASLASSSASNAIYGGAFNTTATGYKEYTSFKENNQDFKLFG